MVTEAGQGTSPPVTPNSAICTLVIGWP